MAFIDYDESLKVIQNINLHEMKIVEIDLSKSLGHILAFDVIATENSPTLPTSAMDGYAFKYKDGIKKLKITGINPAGGENKLEATNGNCIKTFTGSLMPKESDTLIPIENVRVVDDEIEVISPVKQGSNVRAIGENYAKNELLIPKGTKIDFSEIGVMASLNIAKVKVYKKPIVGVVATGSELIDVGEDQTSISQIRSSNHLTIQAMITKYGGEPLQYGCIKDDKKSITDMIINALQKSDIVVTTGGVSVGDYDFVKDVIKEISFEVLFQGVHLKPGQHIMLAQKGDKFILGLPGFAYSSAVTALLYMLPLIGKFINYSNTLPIIKAVSNELYIKKSQKTEFIACHYYIKDGKYIIDFSGKKTGSSGILTNTLGASALLKLNPNDKQININDEVDILFFS